MGDIRVYELTRDQKKLAFVSGAMVYGGSKAAYGGAWWLLAVFTVAFVVCVAEWPWDATRWRKVVEIAGPVALMGGFATVARLVALGMVVDALVVALVWGGFFGLGYWAGRRRQNVGRL